MNTKSLGFIGGGRITKIFLQAFANEHTVFKSVSVYDTNPDALTVLSKLYPSIITTDSAEEVVKQDIVFIALHPPVIMDTLGKIQNFVPPTATVISLAPKISIENIGAALTEVKKIARMIPNATSYVNEGYNPICFNDEFSNPEKQLLLKLLGLLGQTFEVAEKKLEGYAIMSAMLPTYFWFQWKELMSVGMQMGLDEKECADSIFETVIASLKIMYKSGLSDDDVMDLIPVKPIGETESQITEIYRTKLMGLFGKLKP